MLFNKKGTKHLDIIMLAFNIQDFKKYNAIQDNTKQYKTIHYNTISTIHKFAHLYSIVFNQRTEPCIPHMALSQLTGNETFMHLN